MSEVVKIFLDEEFKSLYSQLLERAHVKKFGIEYPKEVKNSFSSRMKSLAKKYGMKIESLMLLSSCQYFDTDERKYVDPYPQVHFKGNAYSGLLKFSGIFSSHTNQLTVRLKRVRKLRKLNEEERKRLRKFGFGLEDSQTKLSLGDEELKLLEILRIGYQVQRYGGFIRVKKPKFRMDIKLQPTETRIELFGSRTFDMETEKILKDLFELLL